MPKLGLTMAEGTVAKWLRSPGERFEAGEPIAVIETDKIATDLEAPASGTIRAILVEEGGTVPVGTPVARVEWSGDADPRPPATAATRRTMAAPTPAPRPLPAAPPVEGRPRRDDRVVATPYARRLARDAGVALERIRGSGAGGRIRGRDVEASIVRDQEEPSPGNSTAARPRTPNSPPTAAMTSVTVAADTTALLHLCARLDREAPGTAPHRPSTLIILALLQAIADEAMSRSFPDGCVVRLEMIGAASGGRRLIDPPRLIDLPTLRRRLAEATSNGPPAGTAALGIQGHDAPAIVGVGPLLLPGELLSIGFGGPAPVLRLGKDGSPEERRETTITAIAPIEGPPIGTVAAMLELVAARLAAPLGILAP